jgi:hypothetical protein
MLADYGTRKNMRVYVYSYAHYTNSYTQIELFYSAIDAWNEVVRFLKLRIGDAEYFKTATKFEHEMAQLIERGRIAEACDIFNGMQTAEKIEVVERRPHGTPTYNTVSY